MRKAEKALGTKMHVASAETTEEADWMVGESFEYSAYFAQYKVFNLS